MTAEQKLRLALRANALSSSLFGVGGLVAADWVVDFLGTGNALIVRLVAAGLVLFGGFTGYASTLALESMRSEALLISLGDIGWVVASIVLISLGLFTTAGAVAAAVIGLMVFDFAAAQLYTRAKTAGL